MNIERRKQIDEVIARVEKARRLVQSFMGEEVWGQIRDAKDEIWDAKDEIKGLPTTDIKDEEEEALGNLSDSLQQGEKGQVMQEAIDNLDSADSCIQEAFEALEEFENSLENVESKLQEAINALQSAKGE